MQPQTDSSSFYDNFIDQQIRSGINDRIYGLYRRTEGYGISGKNILEIGCGIGALSYLLSKKLGLGRLEAFDPSEKSIAFAKDHIQNKQVAFSASDVLNFTPAAPPFDLILLFDVLEHIPISDHPQVFARIKDWLTDEGRLLINLPNPAYILYDQQHQPEQLQELDQPVFLAHLLPIITSLGLELKYFETYGVWVHEDYQFLVVQKQKSFSEKFLSAERNLLKKGVMKTQRIFRKLLHRFP